jgi:hypothetical protein
VLVLWFCVLDLAHLRSSACTLPRARSSQAWEPISGSLLLTHDGGVTMRTRPREAGAGVWLTKGGYIPSMELLSVGWDARLGRWIAGAQDNDIQVSRPHAKGTFPAAQSAGFGGCDGSLVAVDNVHCPARMVSSCQWFAGTTVFGGLSARDPALPRTAQLNIAETFFPDAESFPYFTTAMTVNR